MTALTTARDTRERTGEVFGFPVAANVHCYPGGLAVLSGGYAAPASTALNLIALGRFDNEADNTGGAAGALQVTVRRGIFRYANSAAADAIAQAEVGQDCYLVDDQTVAKTDAVGTRSRAGRIVAVETAGVWVQLGLGN